MHAGSCCTPHTLHTWLASVWFPVPNLACFKVFSAISSPIILHAPNRPTFSLLRRASSDLTCGVSKHPSPVIHSVLLRLAVFAFGTASITPIAVSMKTQGTDFQGSSTRNGPHGKLHIFLCPRWCQEYFHCVSMLQSSVSVARHLYDHTEWIIQCGGSLALYRTAADQNTRFIVALD
jgi:hypothetical protein